LKIWEMVLLDSSAVKGGERRGRRLDRSRTVLKKWMHGQEIKNTGRQQEALEGVLSGREEERRNGGSGRAKSDLGVRDRGGTGPGEGRGKMNGGGRSSLHRPTERKGGGRRQK